MVVEVDHLTDLERAGNRTMPPFGENAIGHAAAASTPLTT